MTFDFRRLNENIFSLLFSVGLVSSHDFAFFRSSAGLGLRTREDDIALGTWGERYHTVYLVSRIAATWYRTPNAAPALLAVLSQCVTYIQRREAFFFVAFWAWLGMSAGFSVR